MKLDILESQSTVVRQNPTLAVSSGEAGSSGSRANGMNRAAATTGVSPELEESSGDLPNEAGEAGPPQIEKPPRAIRPPV